MGSAVHCVCGGWFVGAHPFCFIASHVDIDGIKYEVKMVDDSVDINQER